MTKEEIAWLAGLLEGEGYFHLRHTPKISLAMTDEDVIAKVAKLFRKKYIKIRKDVPNRKDVFRTEVFGMQALWLMKLIKPYMGSRRSAKIEEITKLSAERPGQAFGERAGRAKITNSQAVEVKRRYLASFGKHRGDTSSVIAKEFGISQSSVRYTALQRRFA